MIAQGYSLGTGLALHVAARRAPDGVILSAPYQRLCRLMAARGRVPACLLPGVQKWQSDRDAAKIGLDDFPVLILHGTEDQLVPLTEGRRLNESFVSTSGDPEFVEIPGAAHNDLMSFPVYLKAIDAFVAGH